MNRGLLWISQIAAPGEPLGGSRIHDAREALAYWSSRADDLPWHRRADRREARTMVSAARARLIGAHLERWRLGRAEALLTPLLDTRGRSGAGHAGWLAWSTMRRTALGRRILLAAAGTAAAGLACVGVIAALALHLVGT